MIENDMPEVERLLGEGVASNRHPILRFFVFGHLPSPLREVSASFARQALFILENTHSGAEQSVALRKLLESKDAAVRARL